MNENDKKNDKKSIWGLVNGNQLHFKAVIPIYSHCFCKYNSVFPNLMAG